MTALRSCALCSASGNVPAVVAIAIGLSPRFLRSWSGLIAARFPRATILRPVGYGYSERVVPAATSCPRATGSGWLLGRTARRHHRDWCFAIRVWEQPFEIVELRQVIEYDVGVCRVQHQKVLVIVLGRIEPSKRPRLGPDGPGKKITRSHMRNKAL